MIYRVTAGSLLVPVMVSALGLLLWLLVILSVSACPSLPVWGDTSYLLDLEGLMVFSLSFLPVAGVGGTLPSSFHGDWTLQLLKETLGFLLHSSHSLPCGLNHRAHLACSPSLLDCFPSLPYIQCLGELFFHTFFFIFQVEG